MLRYEFHPRYICSCVEKAALSHRCHLPQEIHQNRRCSHLRSFYRADRINITVLLKHWIYNILKYAETPPCVMILSILIIIQSFNLLCCILSKLSGFCYPLTSSLDVAQQMNNCWPPIYTLFLVLTYNTSSNKYPRFIHKPSTDETLKKRTDQYVL